MDFFTGKDQTRSKNNLKIEIIMARVYICISNGIATVLAN